MWRTSSMPLPSGRAHVGEAEIEVLAGEMLMGLGEVECGTGLYAHTHQGDLQ